MPAGRERRWSALIARRAPLWENGRRRSARTCSRADDVIVKLGGAMWGPDPNTGTVQFRVPGDAATAEELLKALHPDIPITVIGGVSFKPA
jgi:hypothetical protein